MRAVPTAEEAAAARRYRTQLIVVGKPSRIDELDRLIGDYLAAAPAQRDTLRRFAARLTQPRRTA